MQISPLVAFVAKIFLALPWCYWGWYSCAGFTTYIVIYLVEPLLQSFLPALISHIEQVGYKLDVIVNVTVAAKDVPRGMVAELPILVNPLIYSYGLPLTLALILASPFQSIKTLRTMLISFCLFLLIQVWGVSFEVLKILFFQTPPELIAHVRLQPWILDIIALAYQLGVLILPAITPIIIWGVFYYDFIIRFASILKRK